MGKLLRDLWRVWIAGDAIRTSATDRAWLRVRPPCIVLWHGERIEVFRRVEIPGEQGTSIRLECRTPRGPEILLIHPGSLHQPPRCEWIEDGKPQPEA